MTPPHPDGGVSAELKREVVAHYEATLREHGPTARGMDWKDAASQRLRFRVLCEVGDLAGRSLHEVGAGAGHLLDYLREAGIAAEYSGSDLSAAMVETARRRHPEARFDQRDLLLETPEPSYDVVVCSGLFHVCLGHAGAPWRQFVEESVRRMWGLARVAIAFNLISDRVEYRAPQLHYSSPGEMFEFCRRELSRFVVLRHDYPLYEYTLYVYRDAPAR
jgi:SAM-dependent methyltransferase